MTLSPKIQKSIYVILVLITGFLLLTFTFRSPVAEWFVNRQAEKFNKAYNAGLKIGKVRILGLASIRLTAISLKPADGDTLLRIDTAFASIGIMKLLAGRLSLHNVELYNLSFTPKEAGGRSNYLFLLRKRAANEDTLARPSNYASAADQLLKFIFDKIPLSLRIRNFAVSHTSDDHIVEMKIDDLSIREHYFRSEIRVREDSLQQAWTVAGRIDNGNRLAEFRLYPADGRKIRLPYLMRKWQAGVELDTLAFGFSGKESDNDNMKVGGFAVVRGLALDHRMISQNKVEFDKLAFAYNINIGRDFVEVDSSSSITFNRIELHPYLKYRPAPSKQITLHIIKPSFPAQDLFSSFPEGLFTNLDGIRVRGKVSWYLDFFVDLAMPDSLRFLTSLDRQGFGIESFGHTDLTMINEPFLYTAWEHDEAVRTFMVGPENPDFRRLDQLSPFLQFAVMTSEDGGFYQHRGFLPDAFRESMIIDIKERRFARGGSTISMQLMKNVFLNRNKTVARKLEEALIVWLIENQGLSTKERMMEVYLNIIEWGPLVYGANEAARFYFNKDASKLTLAEAIFMASIIPRPKWFKYSFDENGHLRESNADFYRIVSGKMLNKGWISASDAQKLVPDVELRGPARLLLKKGDTLREDTE